MPADIIGLNTGQNNYYCNSKMSAEEVVVTDIVCCASCGIAAVDNVTLKLCDDGCDLVKYCSDECQKEHRSKHKKACKKWKKEIFDKKLMQQPDSSHIGECTICCLPLSLDPRKSTMMECCSKLICDGCYHANRKREAKASLKHRCAFCREPAPKSQDEVDKRIMERIKKNDPVAMAQTGKRHYGQGDYEKAAEYWTMAAELGDVEANAFLGGRMYYDGRGVEKDKKKAIYHLEQAAIGGHPWARMYLAEYEMKNNGRFKRAAKHYIIAANLGYDPSLKPIKDLLVKGIVSEEDYAAAIRGHQAAVDATKSPEREEADS